MVDSSNRSASTTWPASSAGRMILCTRSARAARNRNSSAAGAMSCGTRSTTFRAASATGVPPGSRTGTTWRPSASSRAASDRASVDFPAPSGPSTTMNRPVTSTQCDDGARGALLHAVVDAGVHLRHQLFEVRLRGHDLLIHRIRLHALERLLVLLDLVLRGLAALLSGPLDVLRDALHLGEELPAGRIFLHAVARPEQRLVLLALAQQPAQLPRLLVDHSPSSGTGQQEPRPAEQVLVHGRSRPAVLPGERAGRVRAPLVDLDCDHATRLEQRTPAREQRARRSQSIRAAHQCLAGLDPAYSASVRYGGF